VAVGDATAGPGRSGVERPGSTRLTRPGEGREEALGVTSSERTLTAPPSPYIIGLRFAWWGRVSTEDQQDPTLSLPRQLHNSRAALPPGSVIVAHFYDVESGRKDLDARGHGKAHERFAIPVPRDGGIQDLLAQAASPNRPFDAVICESIERVARRTYFGTKIEHDLERCGVALFAADEPIVLNGKRATTILTRRVKQGVAEWYVLETLEKSWDGFCEHTRQGWNVGAPPYGYLGEKIPHPVPARRAEGKTKTRLVPDQTRAPVVLQIYRWRTTERLGYAEIADRLNADLDRYPVPTSLDPARQRDRWSRSAVREILINPKYTGRMVWNRRASKKGGSINAPSAWVWSDHPTHEPLVTRDLFDAAAAVAADRQGSRNRPGPNDAHPQTKRSYVLRSLVFCALCGRRMFGKTRKGHAYYCCQPGRNVGQSTADERDPEHASSIWVREDALLAGVNEFFAERVFGPHRRELLAADLGSEDCRSLEESATRRGVLERALADIEARQRRLMRTLEVEDDPDGVVFTRVRERLTELDRQRKAKSVELATVVSNEPAARSQAAELLDRVPVTTVEMSDLPESILRPLFEAFRLEVHYARPTNHCTLRVAISEDAVDSIPLAIDNSPVTCPRSHVRRRSTGSHVVGAPGRIRTCDTRFRKPMLYPLSYEGRPTKALVRGHEIVAESFHGSHLIILGRGLAAA
jgi:site-specific DNA recombinase